MCHGPYSKPSTHVRASREESFPSRSRRVNPTNSSSGVEFHAHAGLSGDTDTAAHLLRSPRVETQYDLSHHGPQFQSLARASDVQFENTQVQSAFQHPIPLLPGNSRHIYQDDQPREPGLNNDGAASSSYERGGHASTLYVQPTPIIPNVNSGQARDAGPTFLEHPPTAIPYPPSVQLPPPEVYARPNAQGIPMPIWQLSQSWIDYEGGDDLRLIILFKKVQLT